MTEGRIIRWRLFIPLVLVGVAAGIGGAYGFGKIQTTLYASQTSLVVQQGNQPLSGGPTATGLVSTIRDLVRSDIVASNVIQNLQVHESSTTFLRRVSVHNATGSAVITLRVLDESSARSKQIAQELALVFTQLVRDRFGQSSSATQTPIQVSVFDPAHTIAGKAQPRVKRDLAWGALFGVLAGLLVANLAAVRRRPARWVERRSTTTAPRRKGRRTEDVAAAEAATVEAPESVVAPEALIPTAPAVVAPPAIDDWDLTTDADPQPAPHPAAAGLVLGEVGSAGGSAQIADSLIRQAKIVPFQTVMLAGDPDGAVTAGIAHTLAERGEMTIWVRAADADPAELARLSARCSFVLVADPRFDSDLASSVDAIIAVTDGNGTPGLDELAARTGIRILGSVVARPVGKV